MSEKAIGAPQDPWIPLPGLATDLGAGGGAVWMIGQGGGTSSFGVHCWDEENRQWVQDLSGVAAEAGEPPELGSQSNIAVDDRGQPWIVDERRRIFRLRDLSWERLPGTARDLDCGGDAAWVIGTSPKAMGGSALYRWDETRRDWLRDPVAYGVRIAVDDDGIPWHLNALDEVYRGIARAVRSLPGRGKDLGAGGGAVWRIGTEPGPGGGRVWKWGAEKAAWLPDPQAFAARITVDAAGRPWRAQNDGSIYRQG